MNQKRIAVILSILTLVMGMIGLARRVKSDQTPKLSRPDISDQVVYKHLFNHAVALKKKADDAVREGRDGTQFRTHFKRQAGLTDAEAQALDQIAADCDREVKLLDVRAKLLIQTYKAQYPDGQVPHGELPKPPPAELRTFTEDRDAIVLRGRDRLRTALGESEFNRFNAFVREHVAPNVFLIQPQQSTSASQEN